MAYAELAALRPRAGGEYVYLREAFGPIRGVPHGWTSFVAGFTGAIAASAIVLTFYSSASSRARRTAPRSLSCRCRTCR
jgi:APA family basic amino acid/polyamine antiporter